MTLTWTQASTRLLPRIDPPGTVQTGLCVTPELGVELVLRENGADTTVTPEQLASWGVTAIEASAAAVANLRERADDEIDWLELESAPFLYAMMAGDGDAASRLLVLEELVDVPMAGIIVSVPARGQLLCLPLTHYDVLDDLPAMVLGTQLANRANSAPVSTQLFFFDGTAWTTLAVDDTPGETKIYPSPGLALALETLIAQSLAPQAAEA